MGKNLLARVIEAILDGKAVLITGSGASTNVINTRDENIPTTCNLIDALYKECNLPNSNDLIDAVDTYTEKFGEIALINFLKRKFTAKRTQQEHKTLYSQDWINIYTTNYDNAPFISTEGNTEKLNLITLDMSYREKCHIKRKCIYLNGNIDLLNNDNFNTYFKLNSNSFNSYENIDKSDWKQCLIDDFETAKFIIIVGLSLDYDLDISRVLRHASTLSSKIIFIEAPKRGQTDTVNFNKNKRKLSRFGKVYSIGLNSFAKIIDAYSKKYTPIPRYSTADDFKCFECFRRNSSNSYPSSSAEKSSFYFFGNYSKDIFSHTGSRFNNIVTRKEALQIVKFLEEDIKIVLLHSYFGNGKTIILEEIKYLLPDDIQIFQFKEDYRSILREEIEKICNIPNKKCIIVDDISCYLFLLKRLLSVNLEGITLLFSVRTGLLDAIQFEISKYINIDKIKMAIVDANKFNHKEIIEISEIFRTNGFWGQYAQLPVRDKIKLLKSGGGGASALQSILLLIFNSKGILTRIRNIIKEIHNKNELFYLTIILVLLSSLMKLKLRTIDVNDIFNTPILNSSTFLNNPSINELIQCEPGGFTFSVNSPQVAFKILHDIATFPDILHVLVKIASYVIKYHNNHRFKSTIRDIISYSLLTSIIQREKKEQFLIDYYNEISKLNYYSENHFFWLQYAMACIDIAQKQQPDSIHYFILAQRYIDTSYSLSEKAHNFIPFQIDNQQANLLLSKITIGSSSNIASDFNKAHRILLKPIVSPKDNPLQRLQLFSIYTERNFSDRFNTDSLKKLLHKSKAQAYNMVESIERNFPYQKSNLIKKLKDKLFASTVHIKNSF